MYVKLLGKLGRVVRFFKQHFNVQFIGREAVDPRFKFSGRVDFKEGLKKLQSFEGVALEGEQLFKGSSDTCLHYVYMAKKCCYRFRYFIKQCQRSFATEMSKNNTLYLDMNLQLESGGLKLVVCFSKQRYELCGTKRS